MKKIKKDIMEEEYDIYDDIKLKKRKTITNGSKYDFYIYDMLALEKQISKGKYGKGDATVSIMKDFKLMDEETGEMLDVKLRCSKKINDGCELEMPEAEEVFEECIKKLEEMGLENTAKK
tara:strand:- start:253 stop:612 length:360 start_codon:yes stop_codon:yes gene_type:complete